MRKAVNFSQEELAGRVGIGRTHLSDLETGVAANPELLTMEAIANALGISMGELFADDPQPVIERIRQPKPKRSNRRR